MTLTIHRLSRMAEGGRMLWLLLCLLPVGDSSTVGAQDDTYRETYDHEEVAVATRPHIYYCRSPNMEDFTCWWHPLDNLTDREVTYILTYTKDKGPTHECPDYVTSGPNSCHFDSSHTSIWKIYCMNVTAVTSRRNYTSQEHCLDVAEIVQTEAPVNLSYVLTDAGGDELGHNVLLSWTYPVPSDLQYGWITLVYELQYRRVTEPDNWKVHAEIGTQAARSDAKHTPVLSPVCVCVCSCLQVKHPLREPHVELLGLPVGEYMVRVRCRSHNYGLWSRWSSTLSMSLPARPPAGKLLVLILVTGVGVVALLVIAFGLIPQSKRIKAYFLRPVPKPRIIGIDPMLLKGNLDEINRHFSNFHSYRPPSYTEEIWDQVSADDVYVTTPKDCSVIPDLPERKKDVLMVPCDLTPVASQNQFTTPNPTVYVQSQPPYCPLPHQAFTSSLDLPPPQPRPEIVSLPGTDYSVMGHPDLPSATSRSPQDFYTCVQLMNDSGQVHLVPCLAAAYCREFPPFPRFSLDVDEKKRQKKMVAGDDPTTKNLMDGPKHVGEAERSEATVPLLPPAKG
ncbi:growth hormone receptor isoform X2 [Mastacembelus armatus]|uniref:growth hormone receptor isoform X2 n=1 Tax=Mastacembelus armatus TaxID=205130 RepID=UPI000E4566AC|nr:growth hormone receptor-like isoform X2 [Mastacembelus armatus]